MLTTADYLFAVFIYVTFRTRQPDSATVQQVMKDLRDNDIDVEQLVQWPQNNCLSAELSTEGGSSA
jgi:hypothetical protein